MKRFLAGRTQSACSSVVNTGVGIQQGASPEPMSGLTVQRRTLIFAKSTFGYKIRRRGQMKFPFYRRPFQSHEKASDTHAPFWWVHYGPKSACEFLPKHNYVCGDYVGAYYLHNHHVYTLQHATSGVPIRMRRFPGFYEFTHPSRWLIGRSLRTLSRTRQHIIDEAVITKKQRLLYVKKGYIPA